MRLALAWIGKTKAPSAALATEESLARLRGLARTASVAVEALTGRDPQRALLRRAQGTRLWLLDPAGTAFTSPQFAAFIERQAATYPQELLFAIGGADGFAGAAWAEVRAAAAGRISLSPLTFSHELARLVALEQLYRALAILAHHPYPH